ncbi:MAG: hypothetical protein QHH25_02800 [Candidatus Acetothermia bacterium]|nr:hypothetical protein [Candidatus Acetothermia bacterium]
MSGVRSGLALLLVAVAGLVTLGQAQPLAPGGGPMLAWLPLELAELNRDLGRADLPQLPPGLAIFGASYSGDRRDKLAIGGLAAFGESAASRLAKSVRLSLRLAGLALEYGELVTERWGIFVGGLAAPAHLALEVAFQPAADFQSGLARPTGTGLTRELLSLELYAGGEWALGAQRVRISLGYLWAGEVSDWRTDGRDLPGPSASFSGPLLQVVIVLGI